jgi:hypothetical protein
MRVSLGVGVILATLLSLALYLFGILSATQAAAAFLLLNGIWILVFGVSLARGRDRLYYSGWGVVMASLATFAVLPLQYVLGVVVVAVILVGVAGMVTRPKKV